MADKSLPEKVYVYYPDHTDQLDVVKDIADTINVEQPGRMVGIYFLRDTGIVKNDVKFVPDEQEITF